MAHSFIRSALRPAAYSPNAMCCMVTTCNGSLWDASAISCNRKRSPSVPPSAKYSMFLPNSSIMRSVGDALAMLVIMPSTAPASGTMPRIAALDSFRSMGASAKFLLEYLAPKNDSAPATAALRIDTATGS